MKLARFAKLEVTGTLATAAVRTLTPEETWLERADRAYRRGDAELALRLHARALADDRTKAAAWRGQLLALLDLAENTEAVVWADRALLACPDAADLWAAKAMAHGRCGHREDASRASDHSLRAADAGWLSWVSRGDVFAVEDPSIASRSFDRALTSPGVDWLTSTEIARSWRIAGHPARAMDSAASATHLAPKEPRAWRELGEASLAVCDTRRAHAAFSEAVALAPTDPIARAGLAASCRRSLWRSLKHLCARG